MKNADILFITIPPDEIRSPSMGLAYIIEYLKSKNIKVKVIDFNIDLYSKVKSVDKSFWSPENVYNMGNPDYLKKLVQKHISEINLTVKKILESDIETIAFSINHSNLQFTIEIVKLIRNKNQNIKIICGGPFITFNHSNLSFPKNFFDYLVIGQGEKSIEKIIRFLQNKEKSDIIPGVIRNCLDEKTMKIPPSIVDISKIPFPKYEEFEMNKYNVDIMPFLTSRGCMNKCSFCIDYLSPNSFMMKKPEKIVEEMTYLVTKYKINRFSFSDLLCNGNIKNLEKMCDLIIKSNLKIEWSSYVTIRIEMTLDLLKKMYKAGCVSLCYGVDSGSDKVLKLMNKKYTSKEASTVLSNTKNSGIECLINLIVGFPGESHKNHLETLEFIKQNKKNIHRISNLSGCVIMPNTLIYKKRKMFRIRNSDSLFWNIGLKNTDNIRRRRAKDIEKLCHQLKIPVELINLKDKPKLSIKNLKSKMFK